MSDRTDTKFLLPAMLQQNRYRTSIPLLLLGTSAYKSLKCDSITNLVSLGPDEGIILILSSFNVPML